jgi:transcriptional regulator with XRE-family HTH domain
LDTDTASRSPEETFQRRLPEARKAQGVSQRDLVARLAHIGHDMNQAAVTRIERGSRKVSVDEAFAIAVALDVAPLSLFLPIAGDEPVKLAPRREEAPAKARRWARGAVPLHPANFRTYLEETSGEVSVSAEGLTQEQQEELREEHEERQRKLEQFGVSIKNEPEENGS